MKLTPAQSKLVERLKHESSITFKGGKLKMCERLESIGLIKIEMLAGGCLGMPNWFKVTLK